MKHTFRIFLLLTLTGTLFMTFNKSATAQTGTVIILNGPSCAGKTSIQKAFQQVMMPNLWCKIGIDTLFDASMPNITPENMNFWTSENPIRWVESTYDEQGYKILPLFLGDQGKKIAYAMNGAIAAYAQNGCNVIVDYIAYDPAWLTDLQQKLKVVKTYYVAVDISLEVLEEREKARGTSPEGHARSHYFTVYGNIPYDLRVNSEKNTPEEITVQLKQMIETEKTNA